MRSRAATCFVFFAALLSLRPGAGRAQQITREGDYYVATAEETFDVQMGGALEMDDIDGSVTVTTWANPQVHIVEVVKVDVRDREEAERFLEATQVHFGKRGQAVYVEGPSQADRSRSYRRVRNVDRRYTVRIPQRFDLSVRTSGGSIRVTGVAGEADVKTAGGSISVAQHTGDVHASTAGGTLTFFEIDGQVDCQTAGGNVEVEEVTGPVDCDTAGGEVEIRDANADVAVRTAGGSIEVSGVGGRLEAKTAGGSLDVRDVQDDAVLSTNGGSIDMRDMNGRVRASTNGGDIWGTALHGAVEVETLAGDIDLRDVRGAVEAVTNVGRIDVELAVQDFSRPHEVRLRALHGDIRLTLPARLPANIVARVQRNGRFDSHDITSDFRLTRDEGATVLYAEGEINGGGDLIDIRTSGGDISIRRARQ